MELEAYISRYQIAIQQIYRNINHMLKEHVHTDITADQYSFLQSIKMHKLTTTTEIAEWFCVGKSAITAIVQRLVEKGLLERKRNDQDRRVVHLSLTDKGNNVVTETEKQIHNYLRKQLSHFDIEEIEKFLFSLEKLSKLMDEANKNIGKNNG